jgi:D-alanyl-lipoteichoic acid acyltransferase DltB (MBOAT superfamily)
LGLYYVLNQPAQNILLLLASLLFFYTWGWPNLVLIVLIASLTFLAGKQYQTSHRPAVLFAALFSIVGLFIIYRAVALSNTTPVDKNVNSGVFNFFSDVLIPIGFSFYALQAIGYLIDIKKGRIVGDIRFPDLFLYLA